MTYFTPDKIYICSNKHPRDWYSCISEFTGTVDDNNMAQALIRRLKGNCTEFKEPFLKQKYCWLDI